MQKLIGCELRTAFEFSPTYVDSHDMILCERYEDVKHNTRPTPHDVDHT